MKKISLLAVILFMAVATLGGKENSGMSAPQSGDPIELKEILILPLPGPKSIIPPVQAWFTRKPCKIDLNINERLGIMDVKVEDAKNRMMLQQTVDGNQATAAIILPTLEPGCYTVTIKSSAHLVTGIFEVR